MTSDLDIYRAAKVITKQYGQDAPLHLTEAVLVLEESQGLSLRIGPHLLHQMRPIQARPSPTSSPIPENLWRWAASMRIGCAAR